MLRGKAMEYEEMVEASRGSEGVLLQCGLVENRGPPGVEGRSLASLIVFRVPTWWGGKLREHFGVSPTRCLLRHFPHGVTSDEAKYRCISNCWGASGAGARTPFQPMGCENTKRFTPSSSSLRACSAHAKLRRQQCMAKANFGANKDARTQRNIDALGKWPRPPVDEQKTCGAALAPNDER